MANLHQILQASSGSLQKAEQIALQRATDDPAYWLDLALILSVQGKLVGARQAQTQYFNAFPNCPRVRFGMAPFALMDGELQPGLALMEFGRGINCWGKASFEMPKPCWDGVQEIKSKTLLLHSEGGAGDEMINVRAVKWAHELGAKCVIACTADLIELFSSSGADAVVDCKHANSVYCDYWLPAMSAPRVFNRTWETLWTGPYLKPHDQAVKLWSRVIQKGDKLNIGVRWRGNPQFEHEQLRRFDPKLLFEATDVDGVELWSLQKDETSELPERVANLEPFLTSWTQTAAAISHMDLVITSCTAIAHLAGAMNVPVWVIVPVLPYYVWAETGEETSWYPSARLFRQECYPKWDEPFKAVHEALIKLIKER